MHRTMLLSAMGLTLFLTGCVPRVMPRFTPRAPAPKVVVPPVKPITPSLPKVPTYEVPTVSMPKLTMPESPGLNWRDPGLFSRPELSGLSGARAGLPNKARTSGRKSGSPEDEGNGFDLGGDVPLNLFGDDDDRRTLSTPDMPRLMPPVMPGRPEMPEPPERPSEPMRRRIGR